MKKQVSGKYIWHATIFIKFTFKQNFKIHIILGDIHTCNKTKKNLLTDKYKIHNCAPQWREAGDRNSEEC